MKADDDDDDNGDDDYEMFLSKMGLMVHGRCTESQGTTRTCSDFQFSFGGTGVYYTCVYIVYTQVNMCLYVYTKVNMCIHVHIIHCV